MTRYCLALSTDFCGVMHLDEQRFDTCTAGLLVAGLLGQLLSGFVSSSKVSLLCDRSKMCGHSPAGTSPRESPDEKLNLQ